jgi:hypothetical protein
MPTDTATAPAPPPQLVIIGDSHTRALQSGCETLGLGCLTLTLSGTAWYEAQVHYHPKTGLHSRRRKWVGEYAAEKAATLGHSNLFAAGLPVLLSCMNLGRLSARFRWRGHAYVDDAPDLAGGAIPVSRAMTAAYVERELLRPLELVRELGQAGTDVTVIAPPSFDTSRQRIDATATFAENVRAMGMTCFNPWEHQPEGAAALPAEHAHRDGRHGNAAYGAWVVEHLVRTGALSLRMPA